MALGAKGTIRIGKEPAWGSVASTFFGVEALSETLRLDYDRYTFKTILGTRAEADDMAGLGRIAGDLVVPGYPDTLGRLLTGVLGTTVTSITSALFVTTYNTNTTDFSTDTPYQPFTIDVFRDVTSADRYLGCAITRLALDLQPNQELRLSASVVGKSTATVANTAPSFPSSPAQPFAFETASLSLAGAGTAQIEQLSIGINNNLEAIPALNATTTVAKLRPSNAQMVELSGTLDFADRTEYAKFVAQSEQALAVNLTRAASFACLITIPRVLYTAFPTGIPGAGRLTVGFTGKGYYSRTGTFSGTAIRIALTSTTSDY